jgi:hypothetical protein
VPVGGDALATLKRVAPQGQVVAVSLDELDVGPDLVVGLQARDLGVDEVGSEFAGQRDAVMAVSDEVRAAGR